MLEPSIFTKIINGDIPSYKIYEDDRTYAFLDIHPIQPGHVLVIPKNQIEFVWDLPRDDYEALMHTVQKVALHLREILAIGYVGSKVVGVDVPHAHVHLIPFSEGHEFHTHRDLKAEPDHVALQAMADTLRMT